MLKSLVLVLCLGGAIFAIYRQVLQAPFIWDDEEMVVGNPMIRAETPISKVFFSGAFANKLDSSTFYRPIQILSYRLNYSMSKLDPAAFRLTSILIHWVTAVLVVLLALRLGFSRGPAWAVGLLYAVHPIHIEAVTYIAGRGDALYMLFGIASFICFINGIKGRGLWLILAAVGWILAILSKENALAFPVIMGSWLWLLGRQQPTPPPISNSGERSGDSAPITSVSKRKLTWVMLGIFVGVLGYIAIRLVQLQTLSTHTLSPIAEADIWERLMTIPRILYTYLSLCVAPINLHMEYHFVETDWTAITVWGPFLGLVVAGIASFRCTNQKRWILWLWLWFGFALGPVLQLLPLASTVREHWASLACLGMIMMGVVLVGAVPQLRRKSVAVAFVLIGAGWFSACTAVRNQDWTDPLRLYQNDLALEPRSFVLHNNVGIALHRMGRVNEAKEAFEASINASAGKYSVPYNNLAAILQTEGKIVEAERNYSLSIKHGQNAEAYANLGRMYLLHGKYRQALNLLNEGHEVNADHVKTRYYLMKACVFTGDNRKAQTLANELLRQKAPFSDLEQVLVYVSGKLN